MILLGMKTRNLSDNPGLLCMLNFKNLVFLLFFLSFLLFFFTSQSHLSDKPTIPDKNTAIVGTLKGNNVFSFLVLSLSLPMLFIAIQSPNRVHQYWGDEKSQKCPSSFDWDCSLMQSILGILYSVSPMQNFCILAWCSRF